MGGFHAIFLSFHHHCSEHRMKRVQTGKHDADKKRREKSELPSGNQRDIVLDGPVNGIDTG